MQSLRTSPKNAEPEVAWMSPVSTLMIVVFPAPAIKHKCCEIARGKDLSLAGGHAVVPDGTYRSGREDYAHDGPRDDIARESPGGNKSTDAILDRDSLVEAQSPGNISYLVDSKSGLHGTNDHPVR